MLCSCYAFVRNLKFCLFYVGTDIKLLSSGCNVGCGIKDKCCWMDLIFCNLEEVTYPMLHKDRKTNLVLHRLFFGGGRVDRLPASLSVNYIPSELLSNFKTFIALAIDWSKIMTMFYCIFG